MENESVTLKSPGRRAAAYWFVDGFPEIVLGGMLLFAAMAGIIWNIYAPIAPKPRAYVGFVVVTAVFLTYYGKERRILGWLKARVTWPRTGYVQPPEEAEPDIRRSLITLSISPARAANENVTFFRQRLVMSIWWFWYFFLQPGPPRGRWLLPVMMALLAIVLYVASRNLEHRYTWWSALVLALIGLPFLWWRLPDYLQPLAGLVLLGGWVLAQGLSRLIAYLHAHPLPPAAEGVA
jgi:hypothetical protein